MDGNAWIVPDDAASVELGSGDVAIVRGPDHYTVADCPATPPQIVIHPGQRCTTIDGEDLYQSMDLGVRTWGNAADGSTKMLTGTYEFETEVGRRLLEALPPLLVVTQAELDSPLAVVLADEIQRNEPGQDVILDRLLDLLLLSALRTWLARPETDTPAWYLAQSDPIIGPAIRMLYNNPAHPWTVAKLAAEVGISRASLARRFAVLVGEPPMTFLTSWRLAVAADLLRDPTCTVAAAARHVGYATPYAFSAAFKRVKGVSPTEYRAGRAAKWRDAGGTTD